MPPTIVRMTARNIIAEPPCRGCSPERKTLKMLKEKVKNRPCTEIAATAQGQLPRARACDRALAGRESAPAPLSALLRLAQIGAADFALGHRPMVLVFGPALLTGQVHAADDFGNVGEVSSAIRANVVDRSHFLFALGASLHAAMQRRHARQAATRRGAGIVRSDIAMPG